MGNNININTSTSTSTSRVRGYRFNSLARFERLEIVAHDPGFHLIAASLPQTGTVTKPSLTSTAGKLLLGVATVLYGSDADATAELRHDWTRIRALFESVGIPAPVAPLEARHFRDFRDEFLQDDGGLRTHLETVKSVLRDVAIGQAAEMGLLHGKDWNVAEDNNSWAEVPSERVVMGDGTWMSEMYLKDAHDAHQRKGSKKKSYRQVRLTRSKNGERRYSIDADHRGRAHGYAHLLMSVRGKQKRRMIVLDVERCPNGNEMEMVEASLKRLTSKLPEVDLGFVYDGAMQGTHHAKLREHFGLFTLNQANGFDGYDYQVLHGQHRSATKAKTDQILTATASNGECCELRTEMHAGTLFRVEHNPVTNTTRRGRHLEHGEVRRFKKPDGSYRWELDIEWVCLSHSETHRVTLDPNSTINGRSLAQGLRLIQQDTPEFRRVYGIRNAAESLNQQLKSSVMRNYRARSTNGERHELDLLLGVIAMNAAAWAEHAPNSRCRALDVKSCDEPALSCAA